MTLLQNNFSGGTDGATITTGNSGGASGDAFNSVVGTPVFDDDQPLMGAWSMYSPAGATADYVVWNISSTDLACRVYKMFDTAVTAGDYPVMRVDSTGAFTHAFSVIVNSANKIRVLHNNTGSGLFNQVLGTFANAIPLNTRGRIEARVTQSAGAANIYVAYYLGDSTTPAETPITSTTGDTGASAFTRIRFGKGSSGSTNASWTGQVACQTTAGGSLIGPATVGTVGTVATVGTSTGFTVTGAASAAAALAGSSDTAYVTSADNPSAAVLAGTLTGTSAPAGDYTLQVRLEKDDATTGTFAAKLYDGATLRATQSGITIPDNATTVNVTFPAANISAVTSWGTGVGWRLELTAA